MSALASDMPQKMNCGAFVMQTSQQTSSKDNRGLRFLAIPRSEAKVGDAKRQNCTGENYERKLYTLLGYERKNYERKLCTCTLLGYERNLCTPLGYERALRDGK